MLRHCYRLNIPLTLISPQPDRPPLRSRVAEKTAGFLPARLGVFPQKPARRVLEQNPELVARWPKERYPQIELRAHREGRGSYGPTRWGCAPTTPRGALGRQ